MATYDSWELEIVQKDDVFLAKTEFEAWLGKKFQDSSIEAVRINAGQGKTMVLIKRANNMVDIKTEPNQPPKIIQKPKSIAQQFDALKPQEDRKQTNKADSFKNGRFLKTKGYTKKLP